MYTVKLSATAEHKYREIYEAARSCLAVGDETNSNVALWRMADQLIDEIISLTPFEKGRELRQPFSGVYMVSKEPLRIFYTASPCKLFVIVLSISDDGSKIEAYLRAAQLKLAQLLHSGQLDHVLAHFGLRPHPRGRAAGPNLLH